MSELDLKQLRESLLYSPKNGYDRISEADRREMAVYCADYLDFVDKAKIEREAVLLTVAAAEKVGFTEFVPGMELKPGTKIYWNNRGKGVFFAIIGRQPLEDGTRIAVAHIDSPRLDLKPNPLYEDTELALLKTHYYGGIKKYQWTTIPLAIHGILGLGDGTTIRVSIGEDPQDPVFCITDLLIHLSGDQMKKTLAEGVEAESLNVLVGSEPLGGDEESQRIKLAVLLLLHEKYGIVEEDLLSSELTVVPALRAREVGFDRSLIGAYGHDDRVCAYASFWPLLAMDEAPEHTAICMLADKEEIGSEGVSGAQSQVFELFMEELCNCQGGSLRRCLGNSICLSSDVTAAMDPNYAEVFDRRNNARLNYGVGICKYTGARGKSGSSDASGELVARFRKAFNRNDVVWQITEMGKVDVGGGGTIAKFMAQRNIDTLDAGVPVLSMHAPWEIVSKLDCYMTMKACRVFYGM